MPRIPKPEQIAEFYCLLREAEQLARQTSQPVINLGWGPLYTAMFSEPTFEVVNALIYYPLFNAIKNNTPLKAETADAIANLVMISIVIPGMMFLLYQAWQLLAYAILSVFPSGTATTQQTLKARQLKNQLMSADELDAAISELREHVGHMRKKNMFLIFSGLIPIFLSVNILKTYFDTNLDKLSEQLFGSDRVIVNSTLASTVLWPFQYTWRKWKNYNSEATLKKYHQQLNTFTLTSEWKAKQLGNLNSAIFFLRLDPRLSTTLMINDLKLTVKNKDYITELFRLCIESELPVYSTGSGNIYIGYTALSAEKVNILSKIFSERLLQREFLQQITNILSARNIVPEINYIYTNEQTFAEKYFYFQISKSSIPQNELNQLLKILKKTYGEKSIIETDTVIQIICNKNIAVSDFLKIKNSLHYQNQPFYYASSYKTSLAQLSKGNIRVTVKSAKETPVTTTSSSTMPKEIKWPNCKAKFLLSTPTHFLGRAYPLHDSHEKEGTLFATIDERIFTQAKKYLGDDAKERILAVLDRGAVFQSGKIKTKQGNVGIVDSNGVPYKDLSGKYHAWSKYKIKIGNVRIFCEPAKAHQVTTEDNQNRVAYHFNGISLGH